MVKGSKGEAKLTELEERITGLLINHGNLASQVRKLSDLYNALQVQLDELKTPTPFIIRTLEKITKEYNSITMGYGELKGIPIVDYLLGNNPYKTEPSPMSIALSHSRKHELYDRFQNLVLLVHGAFPLIINYRLGNQHKPDATLKDIFEGG